MLAKVRRIEPSQTPNDLVLESESEKINYKFNIDLSVLYGTNNKLVKFKLSSNSLIEFYLKFKTDNEDDKSSYMVYNDNVASFDKVKIADKDLPSEVKGEILSIFEIGNFLKAQFPKALQAEINQKTKAEISPSSNTHNRGADSLMAATSLPQREFKF